MELERGLTDTASGKHSSWAQRVRRSLHREGRASEARYPERPTQNVPRIQTRSLNLERKCNRTALSPSLPRWTRHTQCMLRFGYRCDSLQLQLSRDASEGDNRVKFHVPSNALQILTLRQRLLLGRAGWRRRVKGPQRDPEQDIERR